MGVNSIGFNPSINGNPQIQGTQTPQRKPDANVSIFATERNNAVSTLQYVLNDKDPNNDKSGKTQFTTDMTSLLNKVSNIQPQTSQISDEINQIKSAMYKYQ